MSLLDALFPMHCPYCNCIIEKKSSCCKKCRKNFPDNFFIKKLSNTTVIAPCRYDGQFRRAVKMFKFNGRIDYGKSLAHEMYDAILKAYDTENIDFITSVPLSKSSLYKRGYNQSEILAKHIHKNLKTPYKPLLDKTKENMPQHSLNKEQRKENVKGVYSAATKYNLNGKTILLIDDIATTGYTLCECANTLYKAGAKKVVCCTYTITY